MPIALRRLPKLALFSGTAGGESFMLNRSRKEDGINRQKKSFAIFEISVANVGSWIKKFLIEK